MVHRRQQRSRQKERRRRAHRRLAFERCEPRLVLAGGLAADTPDRVVGPGQQGVVTWELDEELVDADQNGTIEPAEASSFRVSTDVLGLLNNLVDVIPKLGQNAFVTALGNLRGSTSIAVPANVSAGAIHELWVTVTQTASTSILSARSMSPLRVRSDPTPYTEPVRSFLTRFPTLTARWLEDYARTLDPMRLDATDASNFLPRARNLLVDQLALRTSLIEDAIRSHTDGDIAKLPLDLPNVLRDAYGNRAQLHSWIRHRPTIILVHGGNSAYAESEQLGRNFQTAIGTAANVLSVFWGRTPSTDVVRHRTIASVLEDAGASFCPSQLAAACESAEMNLAGAVDLHLLIKLLGRAYDNLHPRLAAADNINLVAHGQGAVVTIAALALDPPADDPHLANYDINEVLFLGANVDHSETLANLDSRVRNITNLTSSQDQTVRFGPGRGVGYRGFLAELEGVRTVNASHLDAGTAVDGNSIVHASTAAANEIGWWDWLLSQQRLRGLLTLGTCHNGNNTVGFEELIGGLFAYGSSYVSGCALTANPGFDLPVGGLQAPFEGGGLSPLPPTVDGLALTTVSDRPTTSIERGRLLLAEAVNAIDPDGSISRADFYRLDSSQLPDRAIEYIGSDFDSGAGWRRAVHTADWPLGTVQLLVQVLDSAGHRSRLATGTVNVIPPSSPPDLLPTSLPSTIETHFTIVPHRDGNIAYDPRHYDLAPGTIDLWQITPGTAGVFSFETSGNTDTVLGLYERTSGSLLAIDEDGGAALNARVTSSLVAGKTYLLATASQRGHSGNYGLTVVGGVQTTTATVSTPSPVYTASVSDSIGQPHEVDYYELTAPAGVSLLEVTLEVPSSLDGWLRVEDQNYQTVATAFLSGTGTDDHVPPVTVIPGQTYFATVMGLGETSGAYRLLLDFSPDDSAFPSNLNPLPESFTPLVPHPNGLSSLQTETIDTADQVLYYLLSPRQTAEYSFETFGNLDTKLAVYCGRGELLAEDDDAGSGQNAQLVANLIGGEDYYLGVRAEGAQTGSYDLEVSGPAESPATLIPSGQNFSASSGFTSIANFRRYLHHQMVAPDDATTISLATERAAGATDLDVALRLIDSRGTVVARADALGPGGNEQLVSIPVRAGETYTATLHGEDRSAGSVKLHIDFDPDSSATTSDELEVNSTTAGDQNLAAADRNASGNVVLVWDESDQGRVNAQRFDPQLQRVGPEIPVNRADTVGNAFPAVAMAADGSFVVVWSKSGDIFMRRFDSQGVAVTDDVQVDGEGSASQHSIAMGSAGQFVITWTDFDNDPAGGVFAQRFAADGSPIGRVQRVNTTTADFQGDSDVVVAADGSYLIVWEGRLGGAVTDSRVFAQAFDASGNQVGSEFRIHPELDNIQQEPRAAARPDGTKVIVWRSQAKDESWRVQARRLKADNAFFGDAFQVNSVATVVSQDDEPRSVDVATGAQGKFLATWVTIDSSGTGIAAQPFFPDGSRSGEEILMNHQQTGPQYSPALTSDRSDRFLLVWTGEDRSGEGVFGVEHTIAAIREPELVVTDSVGSATDRLVHFGEEILQREILTESITITNAGNSPLELTDVEISGEAASLYSIADSSGFTLAPQGSRKLQVSFDPRASGGGVFYAAVRFQHNDNRDALSGDFDANPYGINLRAHVLNIDFGDAPDTAAGTSAGNYRTLFGDNGPSHTIVAGLLMGATVDGEGGRLQGAAAHADDVDQAVPDDEDGLNHPAADLRLTVGATPTVNVIVTNTTGAAATLSGWIDFNGDGVFDNAMERAQATVTNGTKSRIATLTFPIVPGGFTGKTYARFRISTDAAAASPIGAAEDGEVEDYVATITSPSSGAVRSTAKIASGTGGGPVLADTSYFGRSVSSLGDLDGDGVSDLAVGTDGDDTGGVDRGAVYILLMKPDGTVKSSRKIASGTGSGPTLADSDYFGISLSSLADLDGDGVSELAVGSVGDDTGGNNTGAVYVLFMNANGSVKSFKKIASGTGGGPTLADFAYFGASVSGLGDLNGDGLSDLAVGAYGDDTGGVNRGSVYVLFMNSDGTAKSSQKIASDTGGGPTLSDGGYFGSSLSSPGDLNGDGVSELAAGAAKDDTGGLTRGAVYVLFMNSDGTARSSRKIASDTGGGPKLADSDFFGSSLSSPGDLNRDGVRDLAVGAPGDDTARGAVHLLFMNTDGTVRSREKIASDTTGGPILADSDLFGSSLHSLGDLNGDGLSDLVVGATGDDTGGPSRGAIHVLLLGPPTVDLGDAPDPGSDTGTGNYRTRVSDGGPSHVIVSGLLMGAHVDSDSGTLQNAAANADDVDQALPDDEDGLNHPAADLVLTIGAAPTVNVTVTNHTGRNATLSGWIDYNNDGVFDNATERAQTTVGNTNRGIATLTFPAVPLVFTRTTFARFRLSTDGAASNPTGAAWDGEVEDYIATITEPSDGTATRTVKLASNTAGTPPLDNDDFFGSSVASLGDLDGDGITDLAVGAHADDDGGTNRGAVYVLFMNPDGTVKNTTKIASDIGGGPQLADNGYFGSSVSSLGDLDGDGVNDLAVGARLDPGGGTNRGAVYVLLLNSGGTAKRVQKIAHDMGGGPQLTDNDSFGRSVARLGDLDGDGVNDLAVGAVSDDTSARDAGAVYVLFMSADGTAKGSQKIAGSTGGGPTLAAADYFGTSVSSMGDLDGDGVSDLAVGAYGDDTGGSARGAVHLLFLKPDGTVKSSQKIASDTGGGPTLPNGGFFGSSLSLLGDQDADGLNDLAVGAFFDNEGAVHLLSMNSDGSVKSSRKIASSSGGGPPLTNEDAFGSSLSSLGDLDGDGVSDLAVGASLDDTYGRDRGAVHLLLLRRAEVKLSATGHGINGASNNNRSAVQSLAVQFNRPASVSRATSLRIVNHTTGSPVDISAATLVNSGSNEVTWNLASVTFGNGYYSAELPSAEVNDAIGQPLAPSAAFLFHVLRGDGNGDATVDFSDLALVSSNFGRTVGRLGPGDLDGDGSVDFRDFAIVSNALGGSLSPPALDFGDAQEAESSYSTTLANDGARHILGAGLFLGAAVDSEPDGQPDASSAGDGADEDGVTFGDLQAGATASITVTAAVPNTAVLNAWMDFNRDGDWGDPGEQVFVDQKLTNGTNNLAAAIHGATPGPTFARFRITSTAGYSYFGLAPDGEVEDYLVTISANESLVSYWPGDGDANDLVGGRHGTVHGVTFTAGRFGRAFSCDRDAYINVPDPGPAGSNSLDLVDTASFTAWVRPTAYRDGDIILNKEHSYELGVFANGSLQWAFRNTTPGWLWTDSQYALPLNKWTFFAVTYDRGLVRTYDAAGTLRHTFEGAGGMSDRDEDLRICARGGDENPNSFWRGDIDEVRIFNSVLDPATIRQLAGAGGTSSAPSRYHSDARPLAIGESSRGAKNRKASSQLTINPPFQMAEKENAAVVWGDTGKPPNNLGRDGRTFRGFDVIALPGGRDNHAVRLNSQSQPLDTQRRLLETMRSTAQAEVVDRAVIDLAAAEWGQPRTAKKSCSLDDNLVDQVLGQDLAAVLADEP